MTAVNSNNATVKKAAKAVSSIDNIKKDIYTLKADVVELGRTVQSEGLKKIEEATSELQDKIDNLKREGSDELDKLQEYVKSNPSQSVAAAFLAGAVLTFLLSRR